MAGCASASGARLLRSGDPGNTLDARGRRGGPETSEATACSCVTRAARATRTPAEAALGPRATLETACSARTALKRSFAISSSTTAHACLAASGLPASGERPTLGSVLIEGLALLRQ